MRFKVPQNIDMQDRIVGPLTMTQFIYAIVGSGASYGLYVSFPKPYSLIMATPIALLTFCMIFVKINEQPFLSFIFHVFEFMSLPKKKVWHQVNEPSVRVQFIVTQKAEAPAPNPVTDKDINSLASKIDAIQGNFVKRK